MRNIALSLWFHNCRQVVTTSRCMALLRLRGTVRIWCAQQFPRVLHFLSRRGYINAGLLVGPPRPLSDLQPAEKVS